jgi:hypothetical protein
MSLVLQEKPLWSMFVAPSADIVIIGPERGQVAQPDPEHDLFESLLVESCDIYGIEVDYYPLDVNNFDPIYGENQTKQFLGPWQTKVIYKPADEANEFNIFGMIGDEIIDAMQIPQFTFWRDVPGSPYGPNPGDVIHVKWNRSQTGVSGLNDITYEVTAVNDTQNTFLALKFSYEIKVKPYRFGEEENSVRTASLDPITQLGDSLPLSAWGDGDLIQEESEQIDDYDGIESEIEKIYGYN